MYILNDAVGIVSKYSLSFKLQKYNIIILVITKISYEVYCVYVIRIFHFFF